MSLYTQALDCSKCLLTAFWDLYEAKQADSSGASTQNQAELDGKDSCSVDVWAAPIWISFMFGILSFQW